MSGGGSVLSAQRPAGTGVTLTSSAGSRPAGATVRTSSGSRVRWPAHSVCVPSQCGVSVSVLQLQLAPRATRPLNPPLLSAALCAGGASNQRGWAPSKSCGDRQVMEDVQVGVEHRSVDVQRDRL